MISDTHGLHRKVQIPDCDILIHAGDWTSTGTIEQVRDFAKWLEKQPAKEIIIVPGNHERLFERFLPESKAWIKDYCSRAHLLIHESLTLEGIEFFGSPYTPAFGHDWAFNAGRTVTEAAHFFKPFLGDLWAEIPDTTNFLITHGMPFGILDDAIDFQFGKRGPVGDEELNKRIKYLPHLKYYVGGHLHAQGGKSFIKGNVTYYNAALCDDSYHLYRKPIVIEY